MSPTLALPLNRREAMASLLAKLALVMGVADTGGAEARVDLEEREQPLPSSSTDWGAQVRFFANDEHLPIPRNLEDVQAALVYDGRSLRMDLFLYPDPAWIGEIEQPNMPLGSFVFVGNPATLLDRFSADADAEWLTDRQRWAERPFGACPVCLCRIKEKPGCTNCGGTGYVHPTPDEGLRAVERAHAERQALTDAAWAAADR